MSMHELLLAGYLSVKDMDEELTPAQYAGMMLALFPLNEAIQRAERLGAHPDKMGYYAEVVESLRSVEKERVAWRACGLTEERSEYAG